MQTISTISEKLLLEASIENNRPIVDFITAQYESKTRHYHSSKHIVDIINKAESYYSIHDESNALEVKLALLFHDIIYDTPNLSNESNEKKSSLIWEGYVADKTKNVDNNLVRDLIISTEYSNPNLSASKQSGHPFKLVHDLDFSGIGESYETFLANGVEIRKEYWFVSDEIFKLGREAFLRGMLNMDYIFLTEYYRNMYEEQAIINIQRYLYEEKIFI